MTVNVSVRDTFDVICGWLDSPTDLTWPSPAVDTLRGPVQQLVEAPSAGFALVIGLAGALWSRRVKVGASLW